MFIKAFCAHSSYFEKLLASNSDWKENREGIVLKDEDPDIFERFNLWMYSGKIVDDDETLHTIPYLQVIPCYFFADKRGVPTMHNLAKATNQNFAKHQRLIWDNTPKNSPLRKLLVDLLALTGKVPTFLQEEEEAKQFDKSFLAAVLVTKYAHPNTISKDEFFKKRCEYHIYAEAEGRCFYDKLETPAATAKS
ncbi:MAG: hypothetical protein Q9166_000356 [cf. Caloplaca sp. 2 TL-2023]